MTHVLDLLLEELDLFAYSVIYGVDISKFWKRINFEQTLYN
jgi:hypothetical protein